MMTSGPAINLQFPDVSQLGSRNQSHSWQAVTVEYKAISKPAAHDFSLLGRRHYLALLNAQRRDGETWVDGMPRSTLRDGRGKLIFVPAGCRLQGWAEPSNSPIAFTAAYIDPSVDFFEDKGHQDLGPMLHVEHPLLCQLMRHLQGMLERPEEYSRLYAETLSGLLVAELYQFQRGNRDGKAIDKASAPSVRYVKGGLAAWQHRAACEYIEEHLAEDVSLAKVASIVRLSPFHFCRAFKETLGQPPHRYQIARRIERAKTLLTRSSLTVTAIAAEIGYGDASKFSTAFKSVVGQTPNAYRRSFK
jgi:AraC family transcriptional regulator